MYKSFLLACSETSEKLNSLSALMIAVVSIALWGEVASFIC
jgi:hypothetical protein